MGTNCNAVIGTLCNCNDRFQWSTTMILWHCNQWRKWDALISFFYSSLWLICLNWGGDSSSHGNRLRFHKMTAISYLLLVLLVSVRVYLVRSFDSSHCNSMESHVAEFKIAVRNVVERLFGMESSSGAVHFQLFTFSWNRISIVSSSYSTDFSYPVFFTMLPSY